MSAPSLGVYYCQQLTLSVCPDVTLLQIASSFLFLDGIEPFFGRHFSMCPSTKHCSSIFDLGPLSPDAQNLLPKIGTESPINRLLWQTGDVWAYQGVFRDGRFNGTVQNVVAPTLVAVAAIFGVGAEIQSPVKLKI